MVHEEQRKKGSLFVTGLQSVIINNCLLTAGTERQRGYQE